MKTKILTGSREFMGRLAETARSAGHSLYIQAMTFEGDAAGEELIDLMVESPAKDKRLIIDSFSKVVVSDYFVFGPKYLRDPTFRREIANTKRLVRRAEASGIKVKFVNPTGFLMTKYPLRNHKKMMVVDEQVSYIGGINFSDHNFAWHDMMVEMDDQHLGACLANDFKTTWDGHNQSKTFQFDDSSVFFFNGSKSKNLYKEFFDGLRSAQKSIEVISPYVSEPLLSVLKEVAQKGVEVSIISPAQNNKSIFKNLLLREAAEGYFRLFLYPGMSHLKAILVDGKRLIFGSSNYDLVSYYFEQEVVLVSENKELIADFGLKVLEPMLSDSHEHNTTSVNSSKARVVMSLLKGFCRVASKSLLVPKT